jgi:hypothetical protein
VCSAPAGSARTRTAGSASQWSATTSTGAIRGVDVSGLSLLSVAHIPGNVLAGNWEVVVLVDDRAADDQREAILAAFTGELGGPLADLAELTGTVSNAKAKRELGWKLRYPTWRRGFAEVFGKPTAPAAAPIRPLSRT